MERGHKRANKKGLASPHREDLERVAVRLLDIIARCSDSKIQGELMELADELVKIIDKRRSARFKKIASNTSEAFAFLLLSTAMENACAFGFQRLDLFG
jgi:hypothetical protein